MTEMRMTATRITKERTSRTAQGRGRRAFRSTQPTAGSMSMARRKAMKKGRRVAPRGAR